MNNKTKQTAVVAMATVLSVTTIVSPLPVMAQEGIHTPPTVTQEEKGQLETFPDIILPENLQATAGMALQEIKLPENWAWADESTVTTGETAEYPARYTVDDVTYDYSEAEGYNAEGHYVERMVTVTIEPDKQEPVQPVQKQTGMPSGNLPTTYAVGDIAINETNFPDGAFRTWLGRQSYGTDGTITQAEIANINTINVNGNSNIKDLTGIEHFTALTTLYCYNTGIESLDVSKNTALESLSCYNTGITGIGSLDVSNNTVLDYLDCSNTGIGSLDVSNNTALTTLVCSNTGIGSLDVSKNTALERLYCSNTPLAWLSLGTGRNFYTLDIPSSSVVDIVVTSDSFDMTQAFPDIDISKVKNIKGAVLNSNIITEYTLGTPITYTYECGSKSDGTAITLDVTLNLKKSDSSIEITGTLDTTYTGKPIKNPFVKTKGSTGAVTFTYEKWNGNAWDLHSGTPTDAGKYRVTAHLAKSDFYNGAETAKEFTISQAVNSWAEDLAITGWTYGTTANAPTAAATFGSVSYIYSNSETGTYTDTVPTNAGTWYVKAVVEATDNYAGLTSDAVSFAIAPKNITADNQITVPDITADTNLDKLVIKDGDKILVQGTDYDVAKTTDGKNVTVTITGKGNYTGTITKTYTAEDKAPSGGDKDNKDTGKKDGAVQTGDTTSLGLWSALLAFSAGVAVFLKRKKHEEETEE